MVNFFNFPKHFKEYMELGPNSFDENFFKIAMHMCTVFLRSDYDQCIEGLTTLSTLIQQSSASEVTKRRTISTINIILHRVQEIGPNN